MVDNLLGAVDNHDSLREICISRWNTGKITLVGLLSMTDQILLPLGIVEYDHLVMLILLFHKGVIMNLLLVVEHFHPTSEQFVGQKNFDKQIWRNLMGIRTPFGFSKSTLLLSKL